MCVVAVRVVQVVAGGGAIEMELSKHLREVALTHTSKSQLFIKVGRCCALQCCVRSRSTVPVLAICSTT